MIDFPGIPGEVLEAMAHADFEDYHLTPEEPVEVHYPRQIMRNGPDQYVNTSKCPRCGMAYRLAWSQTKFGKRLVYVSGELQGKIHACDSELDR